MSLVTSLGLGAATPWQDETALEHIAKVQQRAGQLNDLYVVAEGVPTERMVWLEKKWATLRLKQLARALDFNVLKSKQRGDFAMVIVGVEDERNPMFFETMALGFCWVDTCWKAAPLPGLFALSGVGRFEEGAEKSRDSLEAWARDESKKLQRLGEREKLASLESKLAPFKQAGMPLRDGSKSEAVAFFMKLAQQRNILGLIACVGGDRGNVVAGVRSSQSVWSQLLQKNFTYCVLPSPGKEGIVSVGVYFPESSPSQGILEFSLKLESDCWVVSLPESLKASNDGSFARGIAQQSHVDPLNQRRATKVKDLILESLKKSPIETAQNLQEKLLLAAAERDFHRYIRMIDWKVSFLDGGLELSSGEREQRFASALALWQSLASPKTPLRSFPYTGLSEEYALCNLMSYAASSPLRVRSLPLLLVRMDTVWSLVPEFSMQDEYDPNLVSPVKLEELKGHLELAQSEFHARLQLKSVDAGTLERVSLTDADSAMVRDVYRQYIGALASERVEDALGYMAYTSNDPTVLLSTVGADVKRWKSRTVRSTLHSILVGEQMAFVVLAESNKERVNVDFMAYPVVKCERNGYKILPNCYLYDHAGALKMLNQNALKEIEHSFDAQFMQDYLKLIQQFNELVGGELKQNNGNE